MPLTIHVGLSHKRGGPGYSSRGATVAITCEANPALLDDPQQLHEKVRQLQQLVRRGVAEELARADAPETAVSAGRNGRSGHRAGATPTNGGGRRCG